MNSVGRKSSPVIASRSDSEFSSDESMRKVTAGSAGFGILARAAWKISAFSRLATALPETGSSMVKLADSLMQEVLQICHSASAEKVNVSPGKSEAGGVISIRKTGDPE